MIVTGATVTEAEEELEPQVYDDEEPEITTYSPPIDFKLGWVFDYSVSCCLKLLSKHLGSMCKDSIKIPTLNNSRKYVIQCPFIVTTTDSIPNAP